MRFVLPFGLLIAVLLSPTMVQAETITIENKRGEKVKLCTYRSDDKSVIRSRKCWTIKPQGRIKWDRGESGSAFDVRLFEPGAFELPICMKRDIRDSFRIEISPRKSKKCVTPIARVFVPVKLWEAGARVLVNRSEDEYWYPATILGSSDDRYRVIFANGRNGVAQARYISDDVLTAGTIVQCNWKRQGRWYPARIASRSGDMLTVSYDDGTSETATLAQIRIEM